jgi:hypothetical protein
MTSRKATSAGNGECLARCTCGLAFPGPWELTGHFLAVYPPDAGQPPGDIQHADATRPVPTRGKTIIAALPKTS